MFRAMQFALWIVLMSACPMAFAGEEHAKVLTAHGTVEKADKDTISLHVINSEGKAGKTLVLRLTGTSTCSHLEVQNRSGKAVFVQKDTAPKDLAPKQPIAAIYAENGAELVLLTAVVQSEP